MGLIPGTMEFERFEEGNRQHVVFHSFGGDLIEGDLIEKITWPRIGRQCSQITVTIETCHGEEHFTFLSETSWLKAVGQQPLFDMKEVNLGNNSDT